MMVLNTNKNAVFVDGKAVAIRVSSQYLGLPIRRDKVSTKWSKYMETCISYVSMYTAD